jgi:hypothetical protein
MHLLDQRTLGIAILVLSRIQPRLQPLVDDATAQTCYSIAS